jgi:phenylalanyl-tRNA synthetase alpha chain
MLDKIERLVKEIDTYPITDYGSLESFRLRFLVKKGELSRLMEEFGTISGEEKKQFGKPLNELKKKAEHKYQTFKDTFNVSEKNNKKAGPDLHLPVNAMEFGGIHPITLVIQKIEEIFSQIGFSVEEGPEIEDDYHNFSALNFPPDHPARDMQDTFFVTEDYALRTHTSSVQVRIMEREKPPIRVLCPGRVYRNEAVSARSNCFFHQIEGLYIDKEVSFVDLKQTLYHFVKQFFGKNLPIRFRASYFPFTEPSAEMDVYLGTANEADMKLTKGTGWLEILGCGMVDPNVLRSVDINPDIYSGYAFGLGIDRMAMLKYGIKDIRTMFDNDIRFLKQFNRF